MARIFYLLIFHLFFYNSIAQFKPGKIKRVKTIVMGIAPPGYVKDSIDLVSMPAKVIGYPTENDIQKYRKANSSGIMKWVLPANKPMMIYGSFFGKKYIEDICEPGDSIVISYQGDIPFFSGRGSDKFRLLSIIGRINDSLLNTSAYKLLSPRHKPVFSAEDYLAWDNFLNTKLGLMIPVIEQFKRKISSFAYNYVRYQLFSDVEKERIEKFSYLKGRELNNQRHPVSGELINQYGLTNEDLVHIFDTTLNRYTSKWLQSETSLVIDPTYYHMFVRQAAFREKKIFFNEGGFANSIFGTDGERYKFRYKLAKSRFKGMIREEVLSFAFLFARGFIYEAGFAPEIEEILADYYAQQGFPAYKAAVRKYELEQREQSNKKNAPAFVLTDTKGRPFRSDQLKDKIIVMDFWFSGCKGCVQMTPALQKVENVFKNDTNVVFLSISIDRDKEKWTNSIAQKKFTTGQGINLYTGGKGGDHEIIKKYGISGYPMLFLISPDGQYVQHYNDFDPRKDDGKILIGLVKKQLAYLKDGPYVFHNRDSSIAYSFQGSSIVTNRFLRNNPPLLNVQTDNNETFSVSLKPSLAVEPSVFPKPGKLFVLSDIEGNFDAFRELLQANNIIDSDFNWTFGNGHLVFAGDMFDRGLQVTECLWLIYALEEKARAAGGYVHFILGNHEIMNMMGNNNYTKNKYKRNAQLINKTLTDIYGQDSELGRWLRTKNIIEKIGDLLFVHGGVSARVNNLDLSILEINELARRYFSGQIVDTDKAKLEVISSGAYGPFWYRGYYKRYKEETTETVLKTTLKKFQVNRVITGHTISADTVSVHHKGAVINVDTHHAGNKSEGLLIEDGQYYRVGTNGRKYLLNLNPSKHEEYISTN